MMMIKNIIFDMGGVIIDFAPRKTISKYFKNPDDVELIMGTLFGEDNYWGNIDDGTLSTEEFVRGACEKIPERLRETLSTLLFGWWDEMPPFDTMYNFIAELKERGFGIYLLSNTPPQIHEYWDKIPAFRFFDGFVASCDYKCVKPNPEIFHILFNKYSLLPEECFFIDDMQKNIDGAAAVGMKGHCYFHGDVNILRKAMQDEKIL